MSAAKLVLEVKAQANETAVARVADGVAFAMTPIVHSEYWLFRVRLPSLHGVLSKGQAIVGFPKFSTIGIGFAVEKDWNTNLPFTSDAEEIYQHIKHNKCDGDIRKDTCLKAIRIIQAAAAEHPSQAHRKAGIR